MSAAAFRVAVTFGRVSALLGYIARKGNGAPGTGALRTLPAGRTTGAAKVDGAKSDRPLNSASHALR